MFYIRVSDLIQLIAESLYPFPNLSLIPPTPGPANYFATLCFYEFNFYKKSTYKRYHAIFVFVCLAYAT